MSKNYRAELVGAFGNPIDENPTGVMEEAAFAAKGLNFRYLTVKVNREDLEAAMNGVRAFQMKGINLTIPHKVRVLPYLDELSPRGRNHRRGEYGGQSRREALGRQYRWKRIPDFS